MSFKSRLDFILHLTNWFGGRYEPDAGGPEGPLDQLFYREGNLEQCARCRKNC